MSYIEELSSYSELLKDSDIQDEVVMGVKVYPLIRKDVIYSYLKKKCGIKNFNNRKLNFFDFFHVIKWTLISLCSLIFVLFNKKMREKKFIFMGFSRRVKIENSDYIDKFHDPILSVLNPQDCLLIERPFKLKHSSDRKRNCDIVDFDFVIYLSVLLSIIFYPFLYLKNKKDIDAFSFKIDNLLGFPCLSKRYIYSICTKHMIECFFAKLILKITSPVKLIVTSRWLHYPFIFHANKMGIEIIELQHGCVLKENTFYRKFNEGDYKITTMWTFSDFWNSRDWNAERVHSIGNKYCAFQSSTIENYDINIKDVLVISQPELQDYLIEDLLLLSSKNQQLNFYIKLHPQDVDNYTVRYSRLIDLRNVFFLYDDVNIQSVISNYSLVLGYYSTALFEAYSMGKSVGLICSNKFTPEIYNRYIGMYDDYFHEVEVNSLIKKELFFSKSKNKNVFFKTFEKDEVFKYFYEKNF